LRENLLTEEFRPNEMEKLASSTPILHTRFGIDFFASSRTI